MTGARVLPWAGHTGPHYLWRSEQGQKMPVPLSRSASIPNPALYKPQAQERPGTAGEGEQGKGSNSEKLGPQFFRVVEEPTGQLPGRSSGAVFLGPAEASA